MSNYRTWKVIAIITSAVLCLGIFVAAKSAPTPAAALPIGYSTGVKNPTYISFSLPKGWHKDKAKVGISVDDPDGVGIAKIEAKAVQNGAWEDISDRPEIELSENATIYVQVTDRMGNVTTKSVYVECFDREAPTVKASRSGRLLHIEAKDSLSGVAAIYLDGEKYAELQNGTVEIRLDRGNTEEEKIHIQAVDHAGNLSSTYSMQNPYYSEKTSAKSTSSSTQTSSSAESSSASQNTGTSSTGNSTTSSSPAGNGSTTSASPPSGNSTTNSQPDGSGTASSETGENKGAENVITDGDKQFITIETKDGKIFYLIIDGSKDSDNVYLVTEATTSDLQSFTGEEASAETTEQSGIADPNSDPSSLIDDGTLPSDTDGLDGEVSLVIEGESSVPENSDSSSLGESSGEADAQDGGEPSEGGKKGNPIPGWIVILLMVFAVSVAGYFGFVVLPRKKAKEAYLTDEEDEEYSAESYPHESDSESERQENPWDDGLNEEE